LKFLGKFNIKVSMGGNCDWFWWENALVVKCAHRLKGERNSLFPNLIASKKMLGGKNARKKTQKCVVGQYYFSTISQHVKNEHLFSSWKYT
jgi:hypothetical protein